MAEQRVVVVIPAYNAAATLDDALESVAAQTRPPHEVVVGDDCSTDDTASVALRWRDRLPITVVRTERNGGPAAARNAAIAASTSELIALLDSDDRMLPNHLAAMVDAYATTDDGLVIPNKVTWIPGTAVSRSHAETTPIPPRAEQLDWVLRAGRIGIACLFSRARFDRVGGFRTEFVGTEDWDLWIRLVRSGAEIVRPAEVTFMYRLTNESVGSGDRLVDEKLKVLAAAAAEGAPHEQAAIAFGVRKLRAAQALNAAYRLANDGRTVAARRSGLLALRGIRSVALRGAAMVVAPRTTARLRERLRFNPRIWLRRYGTSAADGDPSIPVD